MMAKVFSPCFLILCHIFLNFSLAESKNQDCPKSGFPCGVLHTVGFPFYPESSRPDCGLIKLDCSAKPYPKLNLYGKHYDVVEKESFFLRIVDRNLEHLLSINSCDTFYQNFSFPQSPAITYEVYHNLTLFRCNLSEDGSHNQTTFNGHFQGFQIYDKCSRNGEGGFVVFYKKPYEDLEFGYVAEDPDFFLRAGCCRIQLPIPLSSEKLPHGEGPFGLVNASFLLEWSLSRDCNECVDRGGLCMVDHNNTFSCSKENVDFRLVLKVVFGAVALAASILFGVILVVTIYKRRHHDSLYVFTRNMPSNPDSEGGRKNIGVPIFTHKELEKATHHFASSRELGDGGFGTVYYGKLQDGREVAVKYLYEHNHKRLEQFINEIEILARIRHPNLVTLYGCTSKHTRELLLVYEYIPNGTLADHLHGKRSKDGGYLKWSARMSIAVETARALAYLHAVGVIHRDVKTANILLTYNFGVKVADFGLSRLYPNDVTHISTGPQGTPGYVDPDYHKCYHLTYKSDVYSFGVVLIELVSSMPAVDINRPRDAINLSDLAMKRMMRQEVKALVDESLGFESDEVVRRMTTLVAEVAFQCLQIDKEMRPTMEEVLHRLVEIQGDEIEKKSINNDEILDLVLLQKEIKVPTSSTPTSPTSVIQKWVSSKSSIASTNTV